MKKLLTAFAACMIAGLVSAQVESVNVVGYQTIDVPAGSSIIAPTFTTVGGGATDFTLDMITPSAEFDAEAASGGGTIQFINPDGTWGVLAQYWGSYGGWYIAGTETLINDTPLTGGQGFIVGAAEDATFEFPAVADL